MHPSEYVGGGLEDHIRETPGTYVAIVVRCSDGEDAGWAVAYRPPPECDCTVPPGGPLDSMIARQDCPVHGPDLRAAAGAGHEHTWICLVAEHGPDAPYGCQQCPARTTGREIHS
jgi:hypothetical protein